jgi:5-methylcytosine-specific restriction enzyme subunit McrC
VLQNRIVRATLGRLARCEDLERRLRQESVRLYRRFTGIGDLDLTPAVFDRVVIHRNNRFYAFRIEVCRVLHQCLLVSQTPGQYRFRDFTDNEPAMSRLFQKFVLNFYKREQRDFWVSAKKIAWIDVQADERDRQFLPEMQTDVTLTSPERVVVIDTKYYASSLQVSQFGTATVHSANLYQILTYLRNPGKVSPEAPSIEGVLLYPVVQQHFDLCFCIHGHPVRIATVDLNQPWTGIRTRLLELIGVMGSAQFE